MTVFLSFLVFFCFLFLELVSDKRGQFSGPFLVELFCFTTVVSFLHRSASGYGRFRLIPRSWGSVITSWGLGDIPITVSSGPSFGPESKDGPSLLQEGRKVSQSPLLHLPSSVRLRKYGPFIVLSRCPPSLESGKGSTLFLEEEPTVVSSSHVDHEIGGRTSLLRYGGKGTTSIQSPLVYFVCQIYYRSQSIGLLVL